jgi:mono/diheme cytochrome c family protein
MISGERLYAEPLADGNTFACGTCHALSEPAPDGLRRPGHPIGNATRRPRYKDGQLQSMREAVNTCLTEWMNASPWSEDDPRWQALYDFLDSQATVEQAPEVDIQITQPPSDLSGGDAAAGRELFNGSCAVCHGQDAEGTRRGPTLTGNALERQYIARRVRTSGVEDSPTYDGLTGGRMPFWGADRLSDEELRDVIAYVHDRSRDNRTVPDAGMGSGDGGTGGRECDADHPMVGATADLTTRAHGVMGTARIVDNCTVVIDNFTYDGGGIDVRIYGASAEAASERNYEQGFSMSGNLVRSTGYEGETLRLTLPEEVDGQPITLDDLGGVSVWCVDVGVSFGDGVF